ncbi:MAG: alpha/beta fold hydrolase [Actinomycetota bacterium]
MSPPTPKRRARTSGGEFAYTDEGDGPVVVLLHGFPQSSFVWRDLGPLLSSRFRVIVPDLLGSGDSEKPVGVPLGIVAQAGYVRELLDAIGVERFAVIGHSVGGGVAQLLALDHAGVDAMVLMSSAAFDAWPTVLTREIQRTLPEQEVELLVRSGIRASLRAGMADPDRITPDQMMEYLRPWSGPTGVDAFFRFADAMDGKGLSDREDDLAKLEIPVLIFWGEEDELYPPAVGERLNEAISTSTLGLLPGCRHLLVEDAIETIGPMIYEYLRARYLQEPHGGHGDASGIVTIQLERRPPWVDPAGYEEDAWHDVDQEEARE